MYAITAKQADEAAGKCLDILAKCSAMGGHTRAGLDAHKGEFTGIIRDSAMKIEGLFLNGVATDHVWTMADGAEPSIIGIRMDSGDSGTVYVTREQAKDLADQLTSILSELAGGERLYGKQAV